jgi:hypothetical protein
MTVHQLHYTSCEDGLEGIQGFQISAATPGAPIPLIELAVRASAYEAGPDLAAYLGDGDLSRFPIAFGYVPSGTGAVVFESRYAGTDFTGRVGNYFAHALLIEDADCELAGLLPIELWSSPAWAGTRPDTGTVLPELTMLPPGTGTDLPSTQQFLSLPCHLDKLEWLLSTLQQALTSGGGRLVLTVPDHDAAARWLAAVFRSLPRPIGLGVSFVTYTGRPEDQDVLISCTTPDVPMPAYGDFTVLDLTGDTAGDTSGNTSGGERTRYAAAIVQAWRSGQAESAVRLAEQTNPDRGGAGLDAIGTFLEFAMGLPTATSADEPHLLGAVDLAVGRMTNRFSAQAWQRVCDQIQDLGGPRDLRRWAVMLQAAQRRREPVPPTLLGMYYVAALTSPEDDGQWLPGLSEAELDDVAENAVLPAITGGRPGAPLLGRLRTQRDLLNALLRVIDRRLTDQREMRRLAAALSPEVAHLMGSGATASRHTTSRVGLLTDIVLARNGMVDAVAVLDGAVRADAPDWQHLGTLLWPNLPSADDALRALRTLPVDVLAATGLTDLITQRALRDAENGSPTTGTVCLADELLRSPSADHLPEPSRIALRGVQLTEHFRRVTPKHAADRDVSDALDVVARSPAAIGDRLMQSLASSVLRTRDPVTHGDLLEQALAAQPGRFLSIYRELARGQLAKASPNQVAMTVVIWETLSDFGMKYELVEKTLASALSRRNRKSLDKIGTALGPIADSLGQRAPKRADSWKTWWQAWRVTHEQRGLFRLLRIRGR